GLQPLHAQFHIKAAKRLDGRVSFHVANLKLYPLRLQSLSRFFFNFSPPSFRRHPSLIDCRLVILTQPFQWLRASRGAGCENKRVQFGSAGCAKWLYRRSGFAATMGGRLPSMEIS